MNVMNIPDSAAIADVIDKAVGDPLAIVTPLGSGAPVLAFDVGGTDIKSALFDDRGHALGLRRTPTPLGAGDRTEAVLDQVQALARELRAAHPDVVPRSAGLVVPGIVNSTTGVGVIASNLGWHNAPLRDLASARLGVPIAFDHDVRAASWAERKLGGARNYADAVVLVIGTGIAGALLVNGVPHTADGYAGEIGHSPIADGPVCVCGARGCLEAVASAGAIARRYHEATGTMPAGAKDVIARAAAGDTVAAEIWNTALDALTMALAQLTAVVAPQAVVIGGGLSHAGGALFDELRTRLRDRLSFHRIPELVPAELSGNAGLLGAALRARELA